MNKLLYIILSSMMVCVLSSCVQTQNSDLGENEPDVFHQSENSTTLDQDGEQKGVVSLGNEGAQNESSGSFPTLTQ